MDELTRERFAPVPISSRRQGDDVEVIAERRRILCGTDNVVDVAAEARAARLAAVRRTRDSRLVKVIRRWRA